MKLLCFAMCMVLMCILFRSIFANPLNCMVSTYDDRNERFAFGENGEPSRECFFQLKNASFNQLLLPTSIGDSDVLLTFCTIHSISSLLFDMANQSFVSIHSTLFYNSHVEFIVYNTSVLELVNVHFYNSTVNIVLEDEAVLLLGCRHSDLKDNIHVNCLSEQNQIVDDSPYDGLVQFYERCNVQNHFRAKGINYESIRGWEEIDYEPKLEQENIP